MRHGDDFDRAVRFGIRTGRDTVVMHVVWGPADASGHPQSGEKAVDDGVVPAPQPSRIGFIVSRAVGPAVTRTRVKRVLRHVMRGRVTQFPVGSLIVVRATPRAAGAPSSIVAADVDRAIESVSRKFSRRVVGADHRAVRVAAVPRAAGSAGA